eukprot:scaffold23907_cov69-Phaeocystis_antarctica.AAC.2
MVACEPRSSYYLTNLHTWAASPSAVSCCSSCTTALKDAEAGISATVAGAAVSHATPVTSRTCSSESSTAVDSSTAVSLTVTIDCTESVGALETLSVVLPAANPRRRKSESRVAMLLSATLTVTRVDTSTSMTDARPSPPKVASTTTSTEERPPAPEMRLSSPSAIETVALIGYHTRIGRLRESAGSRTETLPPPTSLPLSTRLHPAGVPPLLTYVPSTAVLVLLQLNADDASTAPVAARLNTSTTPTLCSTALPERSSVDNVGERRVCQVACGDDPLDRELANRLATSARVVDLRRGILDETIAALVEELQSSQPQHAAVRVVVGRPAQHTEPRNEQQHGRASHVSKRGAGLGSDHRHTQRSRIVVTIGGRRGKQFAAAERHERQRGRAPAELERPSVEREGRGR